MRKYKTAFHGEVDLDDPKTYELLPQDCDLIIKRMFYEIGYAYCYMRYFHWNAYKDGSSQKVYVEIGIKHFCEGLEQNRNNLIWLQEQLFKFLDEIENMC